MKTQEFDNWFTFSKEGFEILQQSRPKASVAKELVSNAFDAGANVKVSVKVVPDGVMLLVEDDGDGFSTVSHAWDVYAANYTRRGDPEVSGRFNLGEKELISLSRWAKITTVGTTVLFREDGKRVVTKNRRKRGTKVEVLMPWTREDATDVVEGLKLIIPRNGRKYRVNGELVETPTILVEWVASLRTVLQSAPNQPMRETTRKTVMEIFAPKEGESAMLCELGVPIQPIESLFSANVRQKVPLTPNRDTVRESYLKRIYTEILNATHELMPPEEFAETWVRTGIEDDRVSADAVHAVVKHRYGGADKVMFASNSRQANVDAMDEGKTLIHSRQLSAGERERLRDVGGIQSAYQVYGHPVDVTAIVPPESIPRPEEFCKWVRELAAEVGLYPTIIFINDRGARMAACCTMNSENPMLTFNIARLYQSWFTGRGSKQVKLLIHELAHAYGNGDKVHGYTWGNSCAEIGAILVEKGYKVV